MRRLLDDDPGSTHVLEAVIIATIMLSAVAYVATFEQPPPTATPARASLQQKADDALAVLYDTPVVGSTFGDNLLSILLAQCLQGSCDELVSKLDKLLPSGTGYAIYASNGFQTYPIYVTKTPPGEAVTARQLLEPRWSYTFTDRSLLNVNNETDPVVVYALPVWNSNVLGPGGSPLKVTVKGVKRSDGSNYTLEGFASTLAVPSADAGLYPAVSLNFLTNRTGNNAYDILGGFYPGAFVVRYKETIDQATGWPTNASIPFRLQLKESAGVPVPAGTELTLHVPRGWNASGWEDETWQIVHNATDWNGSHEGSTILAKLKRAVVSETLEFRFNATYRGDMLSYYPFHAALSKGAQAEANIVVLADGWPDSTQTHALPQVLLSAPKPMGATATTTWSLVVSSPYHPAGSFVVSKQGLSSFNFPGVNPNDPTASSEEAFAVSFYEITIEEQNGAEIFGNVIPNAKIHTGAWENHGHKLVWKGRHDSNLGPLNLTFDVVGSGVGGNLQNRAGIVPPVAFDGWNGKLVHQISPGLYRGAFLPDNSTSKYYEASSMPRFRGYDPSLLEGEALTHWYNASPVYRATELAGLGNYTVHPFSPFQDALWGSYVNVNARTIPVGGQVVMTADVQSLLFALSKAGQHAGVTVTLYPPWSGNSKTPIWQQPNLESSLLEADVTSIVMIDMDDDGFQDAVVGTSTGRVFGVNAITGERIQGNVWVAPIIGGSVNAVSEILQLESIELGGEEYVVVGTDQNSGVYVLDKGFNVVWSWDKSSRDSLALDTSTDFDGDGRRDIAVAVTGGSVYVLHAHDGAGALQPMSASPPVVAWPDRFVQQQGTPSGLLAANALGPEGDPGLVVSFTSIPGANANTQINAENPLQSYANPQLYVKTPRAGLNAFDENGQPLWTFLGTPVTKAQTYAHDSDASLDVLAGSSAGYVFMLNGTKGAAPASSALWTPVLKMKDIDAIDASNSAWLTLDGEIAWSYDGWNTHNCVSCEPNTVTAVKYPLANALAMNGTASMWVVGNLNALWRTVDSPFPGYPWLSAVTPVNATKYGGAHDLVKNPVDFTDVTFFHDDMRDYGVVIGNPLTDLCTLLSPLDVDCDESLVMITENGGKDWMVLGHKDYSLLGGDEGKVTADLTRVNFTTLDVGWIVGEDGTLLRSLKQGTAWQGLPVPTADDIVDISCDREDPSWCFFITKGGQIFHSENALLDPTEGDEDWPEWTDMTEYLEDFAGRELLSVGVMNKSSVYVGLANHLLQTYDGGRHWTTLPLGYVQSDPSRIITFPDGSGLIGGGNETHARQWWLGDYLPSSTLQTIDVTDDAPLPSGAKAWDITVNATLSTTDYARARVLISADGGATWWPAVETAKGTHRVAVDDHHVTLPTKNYTAILAPEATGDDVRVRVEFDTDPDVPFQTARLQQMRVEVRYNLSGVTQENETFVVDLHSTAKRDAAATTAVWDTRAGEVRNPMAKKMWTRNVSGEVNDLIVGPTAAGTTAHPEIWVATGDIFAENSPDYQLYMNQGAYGNSVDPASMDENVGQDSRVYLLDGNNGTILKTSVQFVDQRITGIRLLDQTGDDVPDYLIVATVDLSASAKGHIYALDPFTLEHLPDPATGPPTWKLPLPSEPKAIEVGRYETNATFVVGTSSYVDNSGKAFTGSLMQYQTPTATQVWNSSTDTRGFYVVAKDVPGDWFFGPYVVEVRVDWTDSVVVTEGGTQVVKEILQSAKYFDYFLVTPPEALSPPSPIYDVHLVTWFEDWG